MRTTLQAKSVLLAASALGVAFATPAFAQTAKEDAPAGGNDIIVTAQRIEQRLQDVPVSVTVLSAEALANNNITSAKDIASFTPSLVTNNRYGADNTTWTIRGFTQEQRTTATVGTYFADVVAPRGSGATQGGDGAGPGYLFDLANVQVLNGPQGTLFGRNSTGGAVLLVPRKPTDRLEGSLEGSIGDYNLRRVQAVVNVPIGDSFRLRLGVDRNKRDGYLTNAGKIGFGPYGDAGGSVDYWALRVSAVADLSPDVENYTIINYSHSKSTGLGPKVVSCFNAIACAQVTNENKTGFWTVSNTVPDAGSNIRTWQVINTTKWQVNDNLTVKNIMSYGEYRGDLNLDLFGQYALVPSSLAYGSETNAMQVKPFNITHKLPGQHTNAQSSFVEEIQIQGKALDGALNYQGGLYLESSQPLGISGIQSTTFTPCADVNTMTCLPFSGGGANSLGRLSYSSTENSFLGKAAYFQTSYNITDKLTLTGGLRYTWDKMRSIFQVEDIRLGNTIVASAANPKVFNGTTLTANTVADFAVCTNFVSFGPQGSASNPYMPIANRFNMCRQDITAKSAKPTWLLGVDFKPMDDMLLYGKWSRGYRQAGVASFAADQLQAYKAEKVDTYEVGAKLSWRGAMPGYFNVSGFYNDFRDQQIQLGVQCVPTSACAQTTVIMNVGKSRLSGFEAEFGVKPFSGFQLSASWSHLKTRIIEINGFTDAAKAAASINALVTGLGLPFNDIRPPLPGSVLPNSIPDKVVANGSFTLPLPESVGKITLGASWVWQSAYRAVADNATTSFNTQYCGTPVATATAQPCSLVNGGVLPKQNYGNININWEGIGGLPIDASAFVTNVSNTKILLHINSQETQGVRSSNIGEPRMFGFRLKYHFGG